MPPPDEQPELVELPPEDSRERLRAQHRRDDGGHHAVAVHRVPAHRGADRGARRHRERARPTPTTRPTPPRTSSTSWPWAGSSRPSSCRCSWNGCRQHGRDERVGGGRSHPHAHAGGARRAWRCWARSSRRGSCGSTWSSSDAADARGTARAGHLLPALVHAADRVLRDRRRGGRPAERERRFAAPMFAPILNNLVVIATFGVYAGCCTAADPTVDRASRSARRCVLALGTTLGVVAMTVALWPSLRRLGYRWHLRFDWNHPAVRRLGEALAAGSSCTCVANQLAYLVIIVLTGRVRGRAHRSTPPRSSSSRCPTRSSSSRSSPRCCPAMSGQWADGDARRACAPSSPGGSATRS